MATELNIVVALVDNTDGEATVRVQRGGTVIAIQTGDVSANLELHRAKIEAALESALAEIGEEFKRQLGEQIQLQLAALTIQAQREGGGGHAG